LSTLIIKEVNGIPCIVLNEGIIEFKESKNSIRYKNSFSSLLDMKTEKHFKTLLDELKKKLKEKD
jgi:uncharacterized protein YaaR (DUF327 family)